MTTIEGEDAAYLAYLAYLARDKVRQDKFARIHYAGFSPDELEAFWKTEDARLKAGATPLDDLDISTLVHTALRRLGCKTAEGANILREQGRRPYGIGKKNLPVLDRAIANFRQRS